MVPKETEAQSGFFIPQSQHLLEKKQTRKQGNGVVSAIPTYPPPRKQTQEQGMENGKSRHKRMITQSTYNLFPGILLMTAWSAAVHNSNNQKRHKVA